MMRPVALTDKCYIDEASCVGTTLEKPLTLPCGVVLRNRIAKAAMSEQLADRRGAPTEGLCRLYARWARSGAGLLITGNVMIDGRALTEPRNAILEVERYEPAYRDWARSVDGTDAAIWMQLSHPGRSALVPLGTRRVAPSAVPLHLAGMRRRRPHPLGEHQIKEIIQRFATSAGYAIEAGFNGIQIHAAHGYLLSQFLSPNVNHRTDGFGGSPEGRRRLLLEVVRAVRARVGPGVPIGVKLNSADFRYGGLTEEESLDAALALADEGIDLLEISGGTYEAPAMMGALATEGGNEPYFVRYAKRVRERTDLPLMLTGGIRSPAVMDQLLTGNTVDVIGLARPMVFFPDLPHRLLAGGQAPDFPAAPRVRNRVISSFLDLAWHSAQLRRVAAGLAPDLKPGAPALARDLARTAGAALTQAR
jgi:2,4-dienoyl-CoA reductase-like NADH-dependent reductase (Old Yellow Enzyme family)